MLPQILPRTQKYEANEILVGEAIAWPAAVAIENSKHSINGFVLEIDRDEIPALDDFEVIESREYRRRTATTAKGFEVWVYEYLLDLPDQRERIERWPVT